MLNGDGLRVVLFVSGCTHYCKDCHNHETWDIKSGIPFDETTKEELFDQLKLDYIDGLTLSGGDPLNENNLEDVYSLVFEVKDKYPSKTIWIYTGYTMEHLLSDNSESGLKRKKILRLCDTLVDGKFDEKLKSNEYKFAGSTNQKIIVLQEINI